MTEPRKITIRIHTDGDCIGAIPDPRGVKGFTALSYSEGGFTWIPEGFFNGWRSYCDNPGWVYVGKCTGFGVGSAVRFTNPEQSVKIGRYVSAGIETIFMLSGYHEMRGISTCEFSSYDGEMRNAIQTEHGDIIIKNDVWFGDECMLLADSIVENGCVIAARSLLPLHFRSEPYGIYAGSPAKLKKFRFTEKVRELLLEIAWWDMPFPWIKENNEYFLQDMTQDGAVEILQELKGRKDAWIAAQNTSAA